MGVFDEAIRKLADMNQSILMHADINEGPKGRNVCHCPFKRHAGFEVADAVDAISEGGCFKCRTRITTRFFQL